MMFTPALTPYHPLGTEEKLKNKDFPIPISFIYGEQDWTPFVDENSAEKVVEANKILHGDNSNLTLISKAGHNMHMENPEELI